MIYPIVAGRYAKPADVVRIMNGPTGRRLGVASRRLGVASRYAPAKSKAPALPFFICVLKNRIMHNMSKILIPLLRLTECQSVRESATP
jgi:hypothetical protein